MELVPSRIEQPGKNDEPRFKTKIGAKPCAVMKCTPEQRGENGVLCQMGAFSDEKMNRLERSD